MKYSIVIILFLELLGASASSQVLISSYERKLPFYFCNGSAQMQFVKYEYVFANINPNVSIHIDSVVYFCDTTLFRIPYQQRDSFTLGYFTLMSTNYTAKKEGIDTFRIRAYFNNTYSEGTIIVHASAAPEIGFYGNSITYDTMFINEVFGVGNEVIVTDTMHDNLGTIVNASDTPLTSGRDNYAITVRACGTQTIDSIYKIGDFSEIEVNGIPPLPYTMNSGSELVMPYLFTPKIAGKTPHYLVLHTTSGKYLVWSFEYKVRANSSVEEPHAYLILTVSPNPATDRCTIRLTTTPGENQMLSISDLTGKPVLLLLNGIATTNHEELQADLSLLPNGPYYATYTTSKQSITSKLIIAR